MIRNPQIEVLETNGPGPIDPTDAGACAAAHLATVCRHLMTLRKLSDAELVNMAERLIRPLVMHEGDLPWAVFDEVVRRLEGKNR